MKKIEITLIDMPCLDCEGSGKRGLKLGRFWIIKKPCKACGGTGKRDKTYTIRDIMMGKMPYFTELADRIESINTDQEALTFACEAIAEVFGNQFTPDDVRLYMGISQINALFRALNDEKNG